MPTSVVISEQAVADSAFESPDTDGSGVADLDVTRLVRRAAIGDPHAWQSLVDRYGRLIWSITRDFRLLESDAADVFQTTWMRLIEHIDRIEHADRIGSWLAATARNECLRSLAARKRLVLLTRMTRSTAPQGMSRKSMSATHGGARGGGARGHDPAALALAAPHGDAYGRPARFLRGDLRRTWAPGGQHRSDERTLPRPAARPHRSLLSPMTRRRRLALLA